MTLPFEFTIADFDMNITTTPQLIGTGSWKNVGEITFTATYNNGLPDGFNGSGQRVHQRFKVL